MPNRPPSATTLVLLFVSLLFVLIDCKGFSGSRGSGGFKGGSKGAGSFGGSSSFNRPSAYGPSMVKPSGGGFRKAATSFAAGAAGGVAAYAIMRSMSGSGYRSGYYEPGYGGGATCVNNENINGTVFGTFRCPLNGFDYEDKYCCGERERQYCCARGDRNRFSTGASSVIWIFLIFTLLILLCICWARYRRLKGFYGFLFNRRKQDDVVMVPTEVPAGEPHGPPYYHPAPPPMGYPPPPQVNPYAPPPPQAYPMNYNPYQPPQHPPYNPYQPAPGY